MKAKEREYVEYIIYKIITDIGIKPDMDLIIVKLDLIINKIIKHKDDGDLSNCEFAYSIRILSDLCNNDLNNYCDC